MLDNQPDTSDAKTNRAAVDDNSTGPWQRHGHPFSRRGHYAFNVSRSHETMRSMPTDKHISDCLDVIMLAGMAVGRDTNRVPLINKRTDSAILLTVTQGLISIVEHLLANHRW